MKLYVWADPYHVNYGNSMLLVVASDIEEAKRLAGLQCTRYTYGQYENGKNGMEALASVLGDPDRVVDLPCAEWHEWHE